MNKSQPKIFISHVASDWKEIVTPFLDLIQLGCDLQSTSIFCSSSPANIPNGSQFVDVILRQLETADLVISLVSSDYIRSQFCVAEAGAAQLRKVAQGKAESFFSLVIPPTKYDDLGGVLYGVQSGLINASDKLDELSHRIQGLGGNVNLVNWNRRKSQFLANIANPMKSRTLRDEIAEALVVTRAEVETPLLALTFPLKFRTHFRNDTKHTVILVVPAAQSIPYSMPSVPA